MRVYGGSDYAVTADGGDYTVHAVVGLDPEGKMYLLDLWRKQTASDEWVEALCDLVLEWKPTWWAEEKTQITSGVGPYIDVGSGRGKLSCIGSNFPRVETKQSAPSRSAGAWHSKGSTCRSIHLGIRNSGRSYSASLRASTTIKSMRSVLSDSCWIRCLPVRHLRRQFRPSLIAAIDPSLFSRADDWLCY